MIINAERVNLSFTTIKVNSVMGIKYVSSDMGRASWASPFMGGFQSGGAGDGKRLTSGGLSEGAGNRSLIRERMR